MCNTLLPSRIIARSGLSVVVHGMRGFARGKLGIVLELKINIALTTTSYYWLACECRWFALHLWIFEEMHISCARSLHTQTHISSVTATMPLTYAESTSHASIQMNTTAQWDKRVLYRCYMWADFEGVHHFGVCGLHGSRWFWSRLKRLAQNIIRFLFFCWMSHFAKSIASSVPSPCWERKKLGFTLHFIHILWSRISRSSPES